MPPSKAIPTAAEFRLLEILWRLGEGTIEDFLRASGKNSPLHYKTVQTVLRIMENKRFVSHSLRGRAFVYRPRVKRSEVRRSSLRSFLDRYFRGSRSELLVNLLENERIDPAELQGSNVSFAVIAKQVAPAVKNSRRSETLMWFDGSLAGLSTWFTYCVQVVFAYLTTLCICSFIQSPRARVRMWGCFLFLTIVAWLLLWVPPRADPVHFVLSATSLPATSNLHVALPVKTVWAFYVAKLSPAAWRLYALVLLALLSHLPLKSMQLRSVLRRKEQPSPDLELLFRRLCLELGIRHSKLGLVSDLRSPATCYWLRSHVLLPTELIPHLDSDQLADVLRHELTHVRQHDYLWDRLAALGWFSFIHLSGWPTAVCDGNES